MNAAPQPHKSASRGAELDGPRSEATAAAARTPPNPVGSLDFLGALVVATRVLLVPIALVTFFVTIGYFDHATLFRPASEALLRFTYTDPVMRAGCVDCLRGCPHALLQSAHFESRTIMSNSEYLQLFAANPQPTISLSAQAEELGDRLDASSAVCVHGVDEWGSPDIYIVTTAALVVDIVDTLGLTTGFEMLAAAREAAKSKDCESRWVIFSIPKVFSFKSGSEYSNKHPSGRRHDFRRAGELPSVDRLHSELSS